MKKSNDIRNIIFISFFAILIVIPLLTFSLGSGIVSDTENRLLADFPTLLNNEGKLRIESMSEINEWFSDHIGLRRLWLDLYARIKFQAFGIATTDQVHVGRNGWLFYTSNNNIEIGARSFYLSEKELKQIAENQQTLSQRYREAGISYVLLLTPSKASTYPEYLSIGDGKTGWTLCDQLEEYLRENTDVQIISVKNCLIDAKNSGQVFYKTDTHWTEYGAYIAYQHIIEELNKYYTLPNNELLQLSFEKQTCSGDLNNMIGISDFLQSESAPFAQKWESHATAADSENQFEQLVAICDPYYSGNVLPVLLENNSINESSLLIYGDSQMMIDKKMPVFLAEHFSKVCSLRIRQTAVDIDNFISPDVLLFQCSERLIRDVLLRPIPSETSTLPILPIEEVQKSSLGWIGYHGIYPNCENIRFDDKRSVSIVNQVDTLTFQGWAADFVQKSPLSALFLETGKNVYSCSYGSERIDVAENYGIPELKKVGFTVTIPISELEPDGITEIRFHMVSGDGKYLYPPESFTLLSKARSRSTQSVLSNDDAKYIYDLPVLGAQQTTKYKWIGYQGIYPSFNKNKADDSQVIIIDTLDNALIVTGWAADFVNATPLSSLYLSVNGQLLLCDYGQSRLDVAEYYGIEALENVGFSVMVPEELLSPGRENKLSFIMINSKKTGRYDSITYTLKIEN